MSSSTTNSSTNPVEPSDLLLKSLSIVLNDEGFKVPSPRAVETLSVAKELMTWCQDEAHKKEFTLFAQWLVFTLRTCFIVPGKASKLRCEKMWEQYHKLQVSKPFKEEWGIFFHKSLCRCALPTLFQSVSHSIFKKLLELELMVDSNDTGAAAWPITWEEENALRYVAGYVCRKVQNKIAMSSLKDKEEMIQFCVGLYGDEGGDQGTEDWTNAIDRGGLWHVSDDTHMVFTLLEETIGRHLKVSALNRPQWSYKKDQILEAISPMHNEELLFQWTIMTANADDSVGMEVLRQISELYFTVRGFAFANSCLEL